MTPREEKERRERGEGPPRDFGVTNPPQASDYAIHTVQTVLEMQRTLGGVETSIKHLEERSKEYGEKLEQIGKDMHAAKRVGAFMVLVAGFLGFVIHELIPFLTSLKPH
jgi:hypothetical protein